MDALPPDDAETKARLPELLAARRTLRANALRPHPGPVDGEQSGASGKSGTLRAAIFGVNDGLVSNVALIMAFAGAAQDRTVILLAGISGLLAGAFSMGAGEYVSMRVQREMLERLLHLEAHELAGEGDEELARAAAIYERKGLTHELAREVATELMRDPTSPSTRTRGKSSGSTRTRASGRRSGRRRRRSSPSPSERSSR